MHAIVLMVVWHGMASTVHMDSEAWVDMAAWGFVACDAVLNSVTKPCMSDGILVLGVVFV